MDKKRDKFWDAVKGVGYLCVLIGHLDATRYIFNFHMPLFFLVSGMFFSVAGGWRRILRNVGVPWLFFFIVAFMLSSIVRGVVWSRCLIKTTYMGRPYICNSLWFLTCLGFVQLLSLQLVPWLDRVRHREMWYSVVFGMCAFLGFVVSQLSAREQSYLPLMIGAVPMALFFFLIGHLLRGKWMDCLKRLRFAVAGYLLIVLGVGYLFISHYSGWSNMACPVTFNTLPSFIAGAFMGSTCVVMFVRLVCLLPILDFLAWIGKCSVAFFLIEEYSCRFSVWLLSCLGADVKFPIFDMLTDVSTIPLKILLGMMSLGVSILLMPILMYGLRRCKSILGSKCVNQKEDREN